MEDAEATFLLAQRRRRLTFGMGKLYAAVRAREDDERTALEFANSRLLPSLLSSWSEQAVRCEVLDDWASDARFYTLSTRSLAIWKTRTAERQHQRRRDAYAQVRARIKIRVVGSCFARLRDKCFKLQRLQNDAERIAQDRLFSIGTAAFDSWRANTDRIVEMDQSATALDHQKLLGSALSALSSRQAGIVAMDEQAVAFKHESDLALLAAALKRIQWQQFTAMRRAESADALWARNRDTHMRQMLRYWSGKVSVQRTQRALQERGLDPDEPESPSLRPASRAASRSAREPSSGSSAELDGSVPGYMRTPLEVETSGPIPSYTDSSTHYAVRIQPIQVNGDTGAH